MTRKRKPQSWPIVGIYSITKRSDIYLQNRQAAKNKPQCDKK